MARYRIVGRVVESNKNLGYVILNENIRRATVITEEQMTNLFQQTDFVNAEFVDGALKGTENALTRLPEFNKQLQPVEKAPKIVILARLLDEKRETKGFRIINATDCNLQNEVKEYNVSYEDFLKMLTNGATLVNGKLVNGNEIRAIKGNFSEIALEKKEKKEQEPVPVVQKVSKRKRDYTEYRKKQHLDKLVNLIVGKINHGRAIRKLGYFGTCLTLYENVKILYLEVYKPNESKFDKEDFTKLNTLYFELLTEFGKNKQSTSTNEKERIYPHFYAFCSYVFDATDKPLVKFNHPSVDRAKCVKEGIGTKKFKGSFTLRTPSEQNKARKNSRFYWQYETTFDNTEDNLNALGYSFAGKTGYIINETYNKGAFHGTKIKSFDISDYPEFTGDCVGDVLIPYNVVSSIQWMASHKAELSEEEKAKYLAYIEVKFAILAIYNPKSAKVIYDMCTQNGTDTKNWYFLPEYDYSKARGKKSASNAVFYRSGFQVVKRDIEVTDKEKFLKETNYIWLRYQSVDVDASKSLDVFAKILNKIVSEQSKPYINEALRRAFFIPYVG